MTDCTLRVMESMISLYAGDARRIQHFTKVFAYCSLIGQEENLPADTQQTLELAALTHDIGIHACEQKYGHAHGDVQEQEGPAIAERLLSEVGIAPEVRERVCFLIGHHHTYAGVDGLDWRILLEADFLVNALENAMPREAIMAAYRSFFETECGRSVCRRMFALTDEALAASER